MPMNPDRRYLVIQAHSSEFPEPMLVRKGDRVTVGERYDGPEGWPDWYLCTPAGQQAGFVPAQFLDRHADGSATMLEDFTNKELDAAQGEMLRGERELNGWVWAVRLADGETGWVPLENLRLCDHTIC